MPLAVGVVALQSTLTTLFLNTTPANTPATAAQTMSSGMQTFAGTGIPMTVDSGLEAGGQPVAGAVTVAPGAVTANGIGGIDVPSPGTGLAAAKVALISSLTALFSNTTPANTAALAAQTMAQAVLTFLSQAMILTNVTGIVPPGQAVPPPAGPVGPGVFTGTGTGGIDSSSPGIGLAGALPDLIASLTTQFANTTPPGNTPALAASNIADYLETFFLEAMILTTDTGSAVGGPASVAPPPAPPVGSTLPPGSPATGTGTGTIT